MRQRLPRAEVLCVDLLAFAPGWLRWWYPRLYAFLVGSCPSLWALGYYATDHPWVFRLCQPARRCWNALMARRVMAWARAKQPDVIITTHFFPADVFAAARRAGQLACRVIVVITDLFPHRLWLTAGADAIVVGSQETQRLCQRRGIPEGRLHALGIPIQPACVSVEDRPRIARRLGLDPLRRTILVASGGMGLGPLHQLVRRFAARETAHPRQLQLLVVCGENERLRRQLQRFSARSAMPVHVFGFVDTMHELMAVSDLLITKAGGMTIMEALAMGLPMIFYGVIPGQERFNAEYVVQRHAGVMASNAQEVVDVVLRLFEHPQQREAMQACAASLGRRQAAADIVERLVVTSS